MSRDGSGISLEAIRRGLLIMLVVFVASVVGLYVAGRMSRAKKAPQATDGEEERRGELVLSGKGFEYGITEGDREVARIKAKRILSEKQDNYELEGVDLTMQHEDGSVYNLISDQALVNLESQAATFSGNVRFRGPNQVEMTAEGLELRQDGKLLVSSSPVDFVFLGRFVGRADRLRINPDRNVFVLAGSVEVDTLAGDSSPMSLRCRRFSFVRNQRLMRADGDTILTRGNDRLSSRRLSVVLSPDEQRIEFILARWGVEAELEQEDEDGQTSIVRLAGRELAIQFEAGTEDPETADLTASDGQVASLGITDQSGLERLIRANHLVGDFKSGALRKAQAFTAVEISEFLRFSPETVMRRACADEAVAIISTNGELSNVELDGTVMLQEGTVVAFGDEADADFDSQLMQLEGKPSILIRNGEQLEAPKIVYNQATEEIVAEENVRAVMTSGEGIDLSTDVASGKEPIRIEAKRAEWGGEPPGVTFIGQVRAWQGENFLVSDELRGEPDSERLQASGQVKTVWRPQADQAVGEDQSLPAEPLEITADEMVFDRAANLLVYTGEVRAVQLKRSLRCEEIQLYLKKDGGFDRMICEGSVYLQDGESGNSVRGETATYRPGDRTVEVEGSPVILQDPEGLQMQGKTLVYDFETATAQLKSAVPASAEPPDPRP